MRKENLPTYFNLPIDATLAEFYYTYSDITCLNLSKTVSGYCLFKKAESINNTFSSINTVKDPIAPTLPIAKTEDKIDKIEKYQEVIPDNSTTKSIVETKSPESLSKPPVIIANDELRKTYELYEKMFNEGSFGKNAVPEVPDIQISNTTQELIKTIDNAEKSDARQTFEMYEKMFAEGSLGNDSKVEKEEAPALEEVHITKVQNIFEVIPNPLDILNDEKSFDDEAIKEVNPIESIKSAINNFEQNPDDFFGIYNLDSKDENSSLFLKFDTPQNILTEWLNEHQDNIFKLKKIANDTFQFEILENNFNHLFFITKSNLIIDFCELLNTKHDTHSKIKTIRTGKIVKDNGKWIVKDKIKAMYQ